MHKKVFLIGCFFLTNIIVSSCSALTSSNEQSAVCKQRSTYYTDSKVHNAAENIRKYAWAQKEKNGVVMRADHWLEDYQGDYAQLWKMMPSQEIPRSFAVNSLEGCLVCGTAINKYGNYSYLYDKHKVDWKLTCPNCHLTFPTNDFKAYYEGGLEKDGKFNSNRALLHDKVLVRSGKRSNLVNLYAIDGLTAEQLRNLKLAGATDSLIHQITTDKNWGVDSGMGYAFNPNDKEKYGDPYTYVAYYSHWVLWYWRIMPMLEDLSKAYLFTRFSDDPAERIKAQTYADAAIVMLDRIADLYPDMKVAAFPRKGYFGFPNCGYVWGTDLSAGRVIGSVWENGFIKNIMFAYDAVFPAIDNLSSKAKNVLEKMSGRSIKGNPEQIKLNFENGVLREVAKAFKEGNLQGNPSMMQSSLSVAAVVMDHNPETLQWLNIVFKNGRSEWHDIGERDGGSTMRYIVDRISRDGQGDEVSLGYNSGWLGGWLMMADVLNGYHIPDEKKIAGGVETDLFLNPRFEKLFYSNPLLLTDNFAPHIGDTGLTGQSDRSLTSMDILLSGYVNYKTVELAQRIYLIANKNMDNIHLNIFTKNPEDVKNDIRKKIETYGELSMPSENQTAYGLAMMRDGNRPTNSNTETTQRALWMFYGTRNASHNHADPLNIGYIAHDLDLMPEFGYPNTLGGDFNPEQQWDKSTPAHNTVSFDDLGYMGHVVDYGKPLHFDVTKDVQLIHASSNEVENSHVLFAKDYQRTTAMIRIDEQDSYIADFFHVNSNRPYTYNFHTGEVYDKETQYHNVKFDPQISAETYNVKTLRNVRTASISGRMFSVDWNILDTWNQYGNGDRAKTDIHVKITMPWMNSTVRIGEAVPPTNEGRNPHWLPVLMVPGKSMTNFVSVIEGYRRSTKIASIDVVPVKEGEQLADSTEVRAICVKLTNGRVDYIVNSFAPQKKYRINNKFDFCGFFGVYSVNSSGKVVLKYIADGTQISDKKYLPRIIGKVIDATDVLSNQNFITIKTDIPIDANMLKGRYIYVDNSDIPDSKEDDPLMKYNAVYPILSAECTADGVYRLNLGNCSVVRGFKDLNDYSKGYLRDFNIGSKFYIPLSYSNYGD